MVSSIRFSGIASGMDTQAMVDAMMNAKRIPLNKIQQNKQLLEWKRDDYRSMNLLLKEFDTFIFDNTYKQSKMLAKTATSSNSELVTVTASPDASNVSYKIEKVKLATAARIQSGKISQNETEKIDSTKSLWSQRDKLELGNPGEGSPWVEKTISPENQSFTVPEGSNSTFQLVKDADYSEIEKIEVINAGGVSKGDFTRVNSKVELEELSEGTKAFFVDETTGIITFKDGALTSGDTFSVDNIKKSYLEFGVTTYNEDGTKNEKTFTIDGSKSLDTIFNEINKSNIGVNMFYDSYSDKVVVQRTETGKMPEKDKDGNEIEGDAIQFSGASESFFTNTLKLGEEIEDRTYNEGSNAKFTINGLATERASNTFTMNGVTFTLNKETFLGYDGVTNEEIYSNEASSVNIKTDTDTIMKNITDFVTKYNELLDKVNGKLTEQRYKDFNPLSDDERASLSDKEIERWEEKAMSGMLRRDSILSNAMDKMRTNLYSEVVSNDVTRTNKDYNQLAEIGITTTKNYLDRGKLEINEDKLRAAIEADPEAVYQLFMADGESFGEQGLARRLRETISSTIKTVEERAGNAFKTAQSYTMGKQLLDYEDQIARFENRLASFEERYWKQFTAMEKAMQNLNSQSNTLLAYLGQGSGQ